VLAKACRRCRRPTREIGALCSICKKSAEAARPSRQQRGYDADYERAARDVIRGVRGAWARGERVWCVICKTPIPSPESGSVNHKLRLTIEHIVPLRDGGTNDASNLGPAHAGCNYGWRRKPQ
jgi:5-methylcytosine-specific restriction endonuclease McrA